MNIYIHIYIYSRYTYLIFIEIHVINIYIYWGSQYAPWSLESDFPDIPIGRW